LELSDPKYIDLEKMFTAHFGADISEFTPLTSHGSDRQIIRLKSKRVPPVIGIINGHLGENRAFFNFSEHFIKFRLNVPEIYAISKDEKSYLMEDLGNTTLYDKIKSNPEGSFGQEETELYQNVINELVRFQIEAGRSIDYSYCYQYAEFGKENIEQDLNYFKERFLSNFYNSTLDEEKLGKEFEILETHALDASREYFLYRDFQSRNIMLKDNKLYFIDYQSGRKGALQYDLASLLYDARANIPQDIREKLIEYYILQAKKYISMDETEFRNRFWFFAVIRILQAMGAYGYLGIVKGRKKFLKSIPYALKNINIILNEKLLDKKFDYLRTIFKQINYAA
jgi:aminoglycoside/choline kinase family phosphotransferase